MGSPSRFRTVRCAASANAMIDWAGWGTSIGTLVLAGATFAAIRSSNRAARSAERSARIAERSLLANLRPLLVVAPREDPGHRIQFADGRWLEMGSGEALFSPQADVIYLGATPSKRGHRDSPPGRLSARS